ncbi:sarcosine oxidase subunit delta [Komagataeibacter nataicola]|uniref:Sarcosine oxidase subunit delta n=1 Tax=Komagataeibacter nataicola TaxID=265960 RepID=A0A9N7CWM2_9PROT|nr:sarcosine oxidase subunit delta [Komagataeibacter nataicola]AQU88705.1 sarcosine oxidase subunit delta [Komagataeibacter nataicola]PYD66705.1 sarcosine oxidase subunit delta [Komagataeibacter nataicola]WEQ57044.1 sarcosine oxidase subunit delta [Komagataeibacter nataicola]
MRIHCPYCGTRGVEEFTYLGDATVRRPDPDAPEAAWVDYVYLRDNPAGPHPEYWYHAAGCHGWLVVVRDTRTHEIFSVRTASGGAEA